MSLVSAWVLGVALQLQSVALPPREALAVRLPLAALVACGLAIGLMPRLRGLRVASWLALGAVVAWLAHDLTALRAHERLAQRLPAALEGQVLLVEGVVLELPRRSEQGQQFVFGVEQARTLEGAVVAGVPHRLWLGWWQVIGEGPALAAASAALQPGQRWRLPVVLRRPHGTLNPHGFDAQWWHFVQDIGASGHVSAAHVARAHPMVAQGRAWVWMQGWRSGLRDLIDRHVTDTRLAGLVAGLTIGDQSAVDARDWSLFRDAGVAHVLSISGLHITIFATLVTPWAAALWRRLPQACLWLPAGHAGLLLGWCAAWAYALLAGWGLPAQRTVAMLAVALLARWSGLSWPGPVVWLLAAVPVVVLDPWAVGQASFWLSFAAVGLLLLAGGDTPQRSTEAGLRAWLRGLPVWVGHAVRQQAVMALGLAPLAAVFFQQVSWVSVVANLVAVPWITAIITPLALLGLLWPSCWSALPWAMAPLMAVLEALVSWPAATLPVAASAWPWVALALLGGAVALMRLPWGRRAAAALLVVPLVAPPPQRVPEGRFEAWGLDVGQGSAVLVRTRTRNLLVDAGPALGGFDAGARIVVPTLRGMGVHRLDMMVVTHRDADHAGGVPAVLRGVRVARLLTSLEPMHPIVQAGVAHAPCQAGQAWHWDGVRIEVRHPAAGDQPFVHRRRVLSNSMSCVLRIEDAQGRSLLLTGDVEAGQEALMLSRWADATWASDGLLVPHHGSRTSSTPAFVQAVSPRWALAQAGHRNPHGHPAREVVERYREAGVDLKDSPRCGAWHWPVDGAPRCWREEARRHWHAEP